ncbi:MAG: tRNA (adenine-N1)-methyltransferase [Anaerolineae bacterium]|nr:tRNA (adenine-N1)-methyltransferase [Anaerolineae bacterium]
MPASIQPENAAAPRDRNIVYAGDLVLLSGADRKPAIVRMQSGQEYQTHHGVLAHDSVIGRCWGESVQTHLGFTYTILPPSLDEMVRDVHRATQIIYPKEIGYMLMKMNIGPGTHVLEAGTGSGGLTLALARMVQPDGRVYSYEARADIQATAMRNLERVGLDAYVTFKVRDAEDGFDEQGLDAVILDVREPWLLLQQTHTALRGGGFFCSLVPTVNQVGVLLRNLELRSFGFTEVEELLLRPYKAVAARLRPVDRMIAHTGYLIFARALLPGSSISASAVDGSDEDTDDVLGDL